MDVGSTVFISLGQAQQEYIVRQIDEQGIYISPIDNPNEFSLLIRVDNEWKVYDEQLDGPSPILYEIEFLPDADALLSLPYELLLEVALRLPLDSIFNLCLTNFELNELICESEDFWSARTHQDYPDEANLKEEEQTWREFYRALRLNHLWSFGENQAGQLGLGDNQDRNIPTEILINDQPVRTKQISAGYYHSLLIDLNDNVWSFGSNNEGQLGLGDNQDRNIPTQIMMNNQPLKAKQISAGNNHSLFIDLDDNVWSFGSNNAGQLGLGDRQDRNTPTQIMMNNQPLKAKQISAGGAHTLIIDMNDNVWSFGFNNRGQLGLGDNQSRNIPTQIFINNFPLLAKQISAGAGHSLIINLDDYVLVFGFNQYGQLGWGDNHNRNRPTQIFINNQDRNILTQIMNNQPFKAKQISAGAMHSLIIDLNDNVWAFGRNYESQLGLGDNQNRYIPIQIMVNNQPFKAKQISAGAYHSLIIDLNNNVWSFGLSRLTISQNLTIPKIIMNGQPLKARQISAGGDHSLIIGSL